MIVYMIQKINNVYGLMKNVLINNVMPFKNQIIKSVILYYKIVLMIRMVIV